MTNSARALASVATQSGKGGQACPTCPFMQQRSPADHGMFWAIIERAFQSWPENHAFCPADKYELYGWLLIEVGHCVSGEVQDQDTNAIRKSARVFMDLAGDSDHDIYYMTLKKTTRGVRVTIPKSLSYKAAGKRKFEDVRSQVYEVIEIALNTKVEDLKREVQRDAA